MRLHQLVPFFAMCGTLCAQQVISISPRIGRPDTPSGPTGSVTGYIYCGDTHRPARLASVELQPVVMPDNPVKDKSNPASPQPAPSSAVQTQIDGSFTISGVVPGDYYLMAELPGYISPLAVLPRADLNHPTKNTADKLVQLVTAVTVTANSTARADETLIKGGAISGTVQFEDGMPETNSRVVLLRRDSAGKMNNFYPVELASRTNFTDDKGVYRFAGLPEGEYKLYAVLAIDETSSVDPTTFRQARVGGSTTSSLNVYFGNTFRRADSKSIPLKDGEISNGDDVEIQTSKLHKVSGSVVDAKTGAPINSATVQILSKGETGGEQIGRSAVDDNGVFHFAFVPEGTYSLSVTNAREVLHQQVSFESQFPNSSAFSLTNSGQMVTIQSKGQEFGDAQVPLVVTGDMTGINLSVPPKPAANTNQAKQ